jgi:hypothetical protein
MTIDHYEPRSVRPDLVDVYDNLMYACDPCNMRKGDRFPTTEQQERGYRFFRPDHDIHSEHFKRNGVRLEPKSGTGNYTISMLDLNRGMLRRLRHIRERATKSDRLASEGVLGLRHLPIDRLPPTIRGTAISRIRDAAVAADVLATAIDTILSAYASSPMLDADKETEAEHKARMEELSAMGVLVKGAWRNRNK